MERGIEGLCLSVGDLRRSGLDIPSAIPDRAMITVEDVVVNGGTVRVEGDRATCKLQFKVSGPAKWVAWGLKKGE